MVEAVVDSLCKITLLRFIIAKLYFFFCERTSKNNLRGQSHFQVITYKGRQALDFLKVVRLVFWSGVVGPGAFARSRFALARWRSALVRSRLALTVALRAQKLDL